MAVKALADVSDTNVGEKEESMSRLIDADALLDVIEHIDWYSVSEESGKLLRGATTGDVAVINYYECEDAVKEAPTIDAVPVVRCKDCLYWESGENECEKWEYCKFHEIGIGPHSFCSYGERKEGAD